MPVILSLSGRGRRVENLRLALSYIEILPGKRKGRGRGGKEGDWSAGELSTGRWMQKGWEFKASFSHIVNLRQPVLYAKKKKCLRNSYVGKRASPGGLAN